MSGRGVSSQVRGRARGVVVVAVATLALVASALVAPSTAGAASAARPSASPARPISGEVVTFRGTVPARAARAVRLERKQGNRWATVRQGRTSSTGAYALTTRVIKLRGKTTVSYRVVAPRARVAGAVRPKVVSGVRTLTPLGQTAGLRVDPSEALLLANVEMTATFTPARAGREVLFQQRDGDTWTTVSTVAQDATGVASVTRPYGVGTFQVRAVTSSAGGAPAAVSPTRTITVRLVPVP